MSGKRSRKAGAAPARGVRAASAGELDELLQELRAERDRLLAEVARRQQDEHAFAPEMQEPRDEADLGAAQREVDRYQALADLAAARLNEIQAALERAARGRFGRCERCEGAIEVERLRALPGAPLCASCAREVEGEAKRSR